MARPAGLEPTTPWFVARCSNPTELRARESQLYQKLDASSHAVSLVPRHSPSAFSSLARSMRCIERPTPDAAILGKSGSGNDSIYGTCCRVFVATSASRRGDRRRSRGQASGGTNECNIATRGQRRWRQSREAGTDGNQPVWRRRRRKFRSGLRHKRNAWRAVAAGVRVRLTSHRS
jgi:hypothetical protein